MQKLLHHIHKIHMHISKHKHHYAWGFFGSFAVVKTIVVLMGMIGSLSLVQHHASANFSDPVATCAGVTEIPETECQALITLYNSTDGDNRYSKDNRGNTGSICGNWLGISCDNGHVTELTLGDNNLIGAIDLSGLEYIELIYAPNNQISLITLPDSNILSSINLSYNQLNAIDVSHSTGINTLRLDHNQFSSIDISGSSNLEIVDINNNQISTLDITGLTGIIEFFAQNNQLTNIDCPNWEGLERLHLDNNQLSSVNVAGLNNLRTLTIGKNQLTSIDLSGLLALRYLDLNSNQFTGINLSGLYLNNLILNNNQFSSIDLSSLSHTLEFLNIGYNQLTSIDLSGFTQLSDLWLEYNQLTSIEVSGFNVLGTLYIDHNNLSNINLSGLTNLYDLRLSNNQLTSIDLSGTNNLSRFLLDYNLLTSLPEYMLSLTSLTQGERVALDHNCRNTGIMSTDLVSFLDTAVGNNYWQSSMNPSCPIIPVCGNGQIETGEICDDGIDNGTYGHCNLTCDGQHIPVCGDGITEGNESCDDGNTQDADGCNHICSIEGTGVCYANCRDNDYMVTDAFFAMNPTTGEIINAVYGDGNGGNDTTFYTKKRTSNTCNPNTMNVVTLNPGTDTIPTTLGANTIYVLNSGMYIMSQEAEPVISMTGNCIALIGNGDVTIKKDPWSKALFKGTGTNNSVFGGLTINGQSFGRGSQHNERIINIVSGGNNTFTDLILQNVDVGIFLSGSKNNYFHIIKGEDISYHSIRLMYGSDNNTVDHFDGSYGFGFIRGEYSNNNRVQNGIIYNGVCDYAPEQGYDAPIVFWNGSHNALNNIQIFNNSSRGIGGGRLNYFSINNVIINNNKYGGIIGGAFANTIMANSHIFNNSGDGYNDFRHAGYSIFYNDSIYNNAKRGINATYRPNKYFGTHQSFLNPSGDVNNTTAGGSDDTRVIDIGLATGELHTGYTMDCSWAVQISGFNIGPNCTTKGLVSYTPSNSGNILFSFGSSIKKQTQPIIRNTGGTGLVYDTTGEYNPNLFVGQYVQGGLSGVNILYTRIAENLTSTVSLWQGNGIGTGLYHLRGCGLKHEYTGTMNNTGSVDVDLTDEFGNKLIFVQYDIGGTLSDVYSIYILVTFPTVDIKVPTITDTAYSDIYMFTLPYSGDSRWTSASGFIDFKFGDNLQFDLGQNPGRTSIGDNTLQYFIGDIGTGGGAVYLTATLLGMQITGTYSITGFDPDTNIGNNTNTYEINQYVAACGNGITDTPNETCDDGESNGTPGHCNLSCDGETIVGCTNPSAYNYDPNADFDNGSCRYCGDWNQDPEETCDEGQLNGTYGGHCNLICNGWTTYCGDEIIDEEYGETCDAGENNGQPGFCNSLCNGTVIAGCTDSNANNYDPYANYNDGSCTYDPYCGDWNVDQGEACDQGGNNGTYGGYCNLTCTGRTASCGDGNIDSQEGETCDDGNLNGTSGHCNYQCNGLSILGCTDPGAPNYDSSANVEDNSCLPYCGNYTIDTGEFCDQGGYDYGPYGGSCNASCTARTPYCGDGNINIEYENCDDGNLNGTSGHCNYSCNGLSILGCTDGGATNYNPDANVDNGNYCSYDNCGNDNIDYGETCDSGMSNGFPGYCNNRCNGFIPVCGNNIKENGEQCDDGNTNNNDGCSYQCSLETISCSGVTLSVYPTTIYSGEMVTFTGSFSGSYGLGYFFKTLNYRGGLNRTINGGTGESFSTGVVYTSGGIVTGRVQIQNVYNMMRGITRRCYFSGITIHYCGDGSTESGENCDSGILNGTIGYCNTSCSATLGAPANPVCGNNITESGEVCDEGLSNGLVGHCNSSCNGIITNPGGTSITTDNCFLPSTLACANNSGIDNSYSFYDNTCCAGSHGSAPYCDTTDSPFSQELDNAFQYSYGLGIIQGCPIEYADLKGYVMRKELAEMLSIYAIKVLGLRPDITKKGCDRYNDIFYVSPDTRFYIKLSCQLNLMGLEPDGKTPKPKFDPNQYVDRAQFGTIFSRLIYGEKNNVNKGEKVKRYEKHLKALNKDKIMTKIQDPFMKELKGWIILMFHRASDEKMLEKYRNAKK